MDPAATLGRLLDRPVVALITRVLDIYGRAPGTLLANGLAFAALFATFPLLLVVLGAAGFLVDDPEVQDQLAQALKELFPPISDFVDQALSALTAGASVASLLGLIGVIWAVSQLYVTLDIAFSRIFADKRERDVVRRTLRGFIWVAALIAIVVVVVLLGALATTISTLFPDAPVSVTTVRRVVGSLPFLLGMGALVLFLAYRTLPPTTPSVRAIWLPAVIVGIAIVALSQIFLVIAPLLVGAAALAGSLATAFIALAWLSFTFQAMLYGAAWVRVRDEGLSAKRVDEQPGADDAAPDEAALGDSALGAPAATAEPGGRGE